MLFSSNWIIFTAGCLGSGKSSTMEWMTNRYLDQLHGSVLVNMDQIRELLPETAALKGSPRFCEDTQKESGCIAELCVYVALYLGRNVIVDGSMINVPWQLEHIRQLREYHPSTKIVLMHVTTSQADIRHRVMKRSQEQHGRYVTEEALSHSLKSLVDCLVGVLTPSDAEPQIVRPWHLTWDGLIQQLRSANESTVTDFNCGSGNTAEMATAPTEESLLILPNSANGGEMSSGVLMMPALKYLPDSNFEQGMSSRRVTYSGHHTHSTPYDYIKHSKVKSRSIHDVASFSAAAAAALDDPDTTFDESYTNEGIETTNTIDTIDLHIGGVDGCATCGAATVTNTNTNEELLVLSHHSSDSTDDTEPTAEDTTLSLLLALTALDIKETRVKPYNKKDATAARATRNTVMDGCAFACDSLAASGEVSVNQSGSFLAYSYDSQRHHRSPTSDKPGYSDKIRQQSGSSPNQGSGIFLSDSISSAGSDDNNSHGSGADSSSDNSRSSTSTALGHMVLVTETGPTEASEIRHSWWDGDVRHSYRYGSGSEDLSSEISHVTQLFSNLKADIETLLTCMSAEIDLSSDFAVKRVNGVYASTYPQYRPAKKNVKKPVIVVGSATGAAGGAVRYCRRRLTTKDNAANCGGAGGAVIREEGVFGDATNNTKGGASSSRAGSNTNSTNTAATTTSFRVEKGKRKRRTTKSKSNRVRGSEESPGHTGYATTGPRATRKYDWLRWSI